MRLLCPFLITAEQAEGMALCSLTYAAHVFGVVATGGQRGYPCEPHAWEQWREQWRRA